MYYLISDQTGTFTALPLDKLPFFANKKTTNILNIVNFTMQFANMDELKAYLEQQGLGNFDHANIYYALGRGTKENKKYALLNYNRYLYFAECQRFFNPSNLNYYISQHKFDLDFLTSLYAYYLKKNNIVTLIIKKIRYSFYQNPRLYYAYLSRLKNITYLAPEVHELVINLLDLSNHEIDLFANLISSLEGALDYYKDALIAFYHALDMFNSKIAIPELQCLKRMENLARYVNNIGEENYMDRREGTYEADGDNIAEFIRNCCYVFDNNLKNYKRKDDKFVANARGIFDLASFIIEYEGIRNLYDEVIDEKSEESEEAEEEFLEPEDYWRLGIDPEENGLHLKGESWKL